MWTSCETRPLPSNGNVPELVKGAGRTAVWAPLPTRCFAMGLGRAERLLKGEKEARLSDGWPSAAIGLRLPLTLPFALKRGLVPHAKPGLLWSLQICQGMPQGQSHLAADDDRKQHGHFNWVHATPLTKVLLAASLSFWQTARGHCSMKEEGAGDDCPVPSAQAVSF